MASDRSESRPVIADDVRRAVNKWFDQRDRVDVLTALGRYQSGPDVACVHRAILVLSALGLRDVENLVESAHEDYQQLLRSAETMPGMAKRYRRLGLSFPDATGNSVLDETP